MKRQTLLKSTLCLLMALLCNVVWAQTNTDGPIVTFTNVQQDGTTTFTLYINESGQLATSTSSAAELGDAAKFRAIPKDNGKWAFYNEAKQLYMIWRGKGEGHNGDKGVLAEYNATYCDWTLSAGTVSGTHFFYAKRNDTSKEGTLIVMKNSGGFDGWGNTQGLSDTYSNLYRIDSEEYTATLTDNQGTVVTCTTKGFPVPSYSGATLSNPVWTDGKLAATVDAQFPALPFPLSSAEVANPTMISSFKTGGGGSGRYKWYALDDADDVVAKRDAAVAHSNVDKFSWAIYASLENGAFVYCIKNVEKDKYIYSEASYTADNGSHGDNVVILSAIPTKFKLTTDGENRFYYVVNNVNQYLSLNSTGTADAQQLGIYAKTHNGTTNSFHTPTYDLSSKYELVSGGIYAFVTSRGWVGANDGDVAIATVNTSVTPAASTENAMFQWALYQSKNGNYYLYNLGKQKFLGVPSQDMASIPLADEPMGKKLTFKDIAGATSYPIMFSPNNTHAVSQNSNAGLFGWAGGWNRTDDAGSNHKVSYIGSLTADQLKTIADLVEAYDKRLYVTAEVEDSWENNPNTHFGRVRATSSTGSITTKLNIDMDVVAIDYDGLNETTIDFTRDYRGFEFQGYSFGGVDLGKSFTLTAEQKASITEQNPLVAKFRATEDVTLFYDDDVKSYRIPAIGKTSTGRLIAVSDYRHNLDDIGMDRGSTGSHRIDLVIRTSDDNGKTWSPKQTIAEGTDVRGADDCAFGDAAIAVVGQKVLVMAAAGDVIFADGTADAHNRTWRVYSEDNGATWNKEDISTKLFIGADATIPNGYTAFFGSGKLAVDSVFVGTPAQPRIYGAMLIKNASGTYNNFVIYTDNFGADWSILGGSTSPIANQDEPKVEILPSGQILFSVRRGGGRQFNVFTYGTGENDKANGVGTWNGNVNGCDNEGSNSTNGEIYLVDAKRPDGTAVKLLFQSQPVGGGTWDRENVSIWYKEINGAADYVHTSSEIASGWTKGMQVSHQLSAYSTMVLQNDGRIAFFFEEAPCYNDNYVRGYCMVYTPLTIDQITKGHYFAPDTDLTTERTINVVLTDAQGNEYRDQVTSSFGNIATSLTTKYPYITLGDNAGLSVENGAYTYTNTVTLPFKVSNEETTVWHNIYWPSNGNDASQRYPVYLSATATDDEFVPKVTESNAYGNSSYNTAGKADNISWAVYSVNDGFAFKFKNKLTGKFIQATGVATGNSKNVKYVDEASATAFVLDNVKQGDKCYGDYALKAEINGTVGYLCSTSATGYHFATHYNGKGHAGAWARFAEAPDFDALIDEVSATLEMMGTGLGQYTASEANVAVATTAKEAMKNSATVKFNTLNTYRNLLEGATLNLPVAGQYFRIRGISGNYIDASSIHGNATATTGQMSMKSAEACNYNGTIFYLDEEKHLLNYATGTYTKQTSHIGAVGDTDKAVWTITESPRKGGKYALQNTVTSGQNGQHLHDSDGNRADRCGSNCGNRHDFTLEEVTELPVSISGVGYGTLYAPVALEIPGHVKAYTGAIEGDLLILTKITSGVIPAGTAVVLYRDKDSYDVAPTGATAHNFVITTTTESVANNAFHGSVATIARSSVQGEAYTLQTDTESAIGVAFKPSATNIASGKAYLVLPSQEGANMLRIRFAGTTEIDNSEFSIQQSELVYDLAGRRVEKMEKGIYIVNCKKVVIR